MGKVVGEDVGKCVEVWEEEYKDMWKNVGRGVAV